MSPVLMFALPLLAAFLQGTVTRVSATAGRVLGPLTLLLMAAIGLHAWPAVMQSTLTVELGAFRPPLGIVFFIDPLALLLAIAVALAVLLLWPRDDAPDAPRERMLMLVLAAAGTGLAFSGDLFNLYVFYELTAVASYGLAAAKRSAAANAATIRYVVLSSFGAAMMLIGIALIYSVTGTLNLAQLAQLADGTLQGGLGLAAFVFILVGAGVKAELFPVNTWVPEVYATASVRVAGLLAGVVSKLALVMVVRLLVLVFHQPEALQILLLLGMLGVVSGELAAWRAQDLRHMLAFSSIGQLGVMFIAFSIPGVAGLTAGLAVALHHLVVKPALFLLAGRWGAALPQLAGGSRAAPLAAVLFILLSMSLIGIPPLPGFWAKFLVVSAALSQGAPLYALAVLVILVAAVVEASYLFRVVARLYQPAAAAQRRPAPAGRPLAVAGVLGGVLLVSMLFIAPVGDGLRSVSVRLADASAYVDVVNPGSSAP